MEEIKANTLLEFNKNQLQSVRKELGYGDVIKLKQDIENLRDWIKMQNHFRVKEFDDGFLERLLIYNKGSIERTKQRFDKFCTSTNLMPEFLQNFDIKNEFKSIQTVCDFFVMPKPTDDNYRLLITKITGEDDDDFSALVFYRYLIMVGHYMLCHDYCYGYEWIGDVRKITFKTASKVNPIVVHKALNLITESMGQRMKNIHFLSGSKFFDIIFNLFRQGLSAKLKERVLVHASLESLYEYVPKDRLPKELGGYGPSCSEINEMNFKELSSDAHVAQVKFMESIGTDESQRLACKFNEEYSGMPGSFKTLCVD